MRQGYIKAAAVIPDIVVADTETNAARICKGIREAEQNGAKIIVLPELCITGYTCGDLFLQDALLCAAKRALINIAKETEELDCISFVGLPFAYNGKLYNAAAAIR